MNRRQFVGLSAVAVAGALGGCGRGATTGDTDAAQRFLTERNGGTPVALSGPMGGPATIGYIDRVDGSTLTIRSPIDDATTTVELVDDAKIHKDVDVELSALEPGDHVTAFGSPEGDSFQASAMRVGGPDDSLAGGGPMMFSGGPGGSGSGDQFDTVVGGPGGAPAGGANMPVRVEPLTGTVERVDGRTIVVKQADGASTKVALADGARIQRLGEATLAELTAGTFVAAAGERDGNAIRARDVRILPAPEVKTSQ